MSEGISGARIVVIGGAGLIGRPTVELLVRSGARVTSFDRRAGDFFPGAEHVVGDLREAATVHRVIAGADAVVHLGGIPGPNLVDDITTYEINTVGTYSVFAAAAAAGVRKVVYASSINANGLPIGKLKAPSRIPYDEDEPAAIGDSYSLSKEANERAAVMAAARWGMALTGLRFPLVRDITIDGGARFAAHLRAALRDDPIRQAYEGWSYLDVSDAARSVVAALTHDTPPAPGILVAAALTYLSGSTADAVAAVIPGTSLGDIVGRQVGLDLTRSSTLLDFEAEVLLEDIGHDLLVSVDGS